MQKLDGKGFIFLDDNRRPFLCRMWNDSAWLFYWHRHQKSWVSLRRVTQSEIWTFPHNLTDEQQQHYHDAHDKWMRENQAQFIDLGSIDSE